MGEVRNPLAQQSGDADGVGFTSVCGAKRLPQPSPAGQSLQRHYSHSDRYNDHICHNEVTLRCECGGIRNIGLRPTLVGRSTVMSTPTGDLE